VPLAVNVWTSPQVLTVQSPDLPDPTVTQAVVATPQVPELVCLMAIVSPVFTPVTGPATNAPPLMDMAEQVPPHVTVWFLKGPLRVIVLLV
jgi:hypothetical protein